MGHKVQRMLQVPNVNKFHRTRIFTFGKNPYNEIYVEVDGNKNYVGFTFGMMGEGVIEVGYSSVNGAASSGSSEDCIALLKSASILFLRNNPIPTSQHDVLSLLYNLATLIDEVYNDWLYGQHKG
jgi:hypothetical protein